MKTGLLTAETVLAIAAMAVADPPLHLGWRWEVGDSLRYRTTWTTASKLKPARGRPSAGMVK